MAKELEDAFDEEEEDEDALKPDRTYRYKTSGRNQRPGSNLKGKKVDWEATIEVPLEELIYPSLQHFDITTKDVYGATGIDKELQVTMKESAVAGKFTSTTPKWVASIDDTPYEERHEEAAGKEGRYSVPDILRRGEIHLRRRLKDSAAVDLMAHVKGWPQLAGKPKLTETEQITASVVRASPPQPHNLTPTFCVRSHVLPPCCLGVCVCVCVCVVQYVDLCKAHTFTPVEDPKRTVAQLHATLGSTGLSDVDADAAAGATLRGVRDHKAAHAASKAAAAAAAAALEKAPDVAAAAAVAPKDETDVERRRRHNVDAMQGAFAFTPAIDAGNALTSTYIETGGELPIFKPPPAEVGPKRKVCFITCASPPPPTHPPTHPPATTTHTALP